MRKYLFAGAVVVGGLLLAAPAHADDQPAPAGGVLGGLLNPAGGIDPTDGLDLESPLGGDVVAVKPGTNSPDLTGAAGDALRAPDGRPAARTGLGAQPANRTRAGSVLGRGGAAQKAAAVGEGLPTPGGLPALGNLPVGDLLGGGLPPIRGLMPDGRAPFAVPVARESGLLGGGGPLLGGLGGLLPDDQAQALRALDETPGTSGMPADGTPVPAGEPGPSIPADSAGPGDDSKRLHEEPLDGEAKSRRTFSDGRPVAGEDPEYR
jgi:hypothetical protein